MSGKLIQFSPGSTDSLFDAQVGQRRVQEGEPLICGVGMHLDRQRHRHGDIPLQLHPHHLAPRLRGILTSRPLLFLPGRALYLVGGQFDSWIGISEKNRSASLRPWLLCTSCVCAFLSLASRHPSAALSPVYVADMKVRNVPLWREVY